MMSAVPARAHLIVVLSALLNACSSASNSAGPETNPTSGGGETSSTDELTPANVSAPDATSSRAELAESMATNRIVPYAETWTVLADGARVAPGRVRLFYSRRIVDEADRASGVHQAETDYWNREHVWPRSFGVGDTAADSDLHNLVPEDVTVNAERGNRIYDDDGTVPGECGSCLLGQDSWAPPKEVRGDAARIAFYMDVRYDGVGDGDVPDLSLGDDPETVAHRFGKLSTLLRWHCADPVSAEEVQRHEAAAVAQGNRNAFVDVPVLVASVYEFDCP